MIEQEVYRIEAINEQMKKAAKAHDWSKLNQLAALHNHTLNTLFTENAHEVNSKSWEEALLKLEQLNEDITLYIAKARQETLVRQWQLKEAKKAKLRYDTTIC